VVKTDWELRQEDNGKLVLARYQTPLWLWLLDRWFRVPDFVFDRIEWWFPSTSRFTRIPCLMYSRWLPELIVRRDWTEYDATPRPEPSGDESDDAPTSSSGMAQLVVR
jgi:hypothetical protein